MCCIVHDDNDYEDALMKQLPWINKHTHSIQKIISVKKDTVLKLHWRRKNIRLFSHYI